MEKFSELKRDIIIGIVEKEQETSTDTGVCLCATYTYTHGNNLIPISFLKILVHIVHFCVARTSFSLLKSVIASL